MKNYFEERYIALFLTVLSHYRTIPYEFYEEISNIKHFRGGVLFVWSLVYKYVQRLLIRKTTTLSKIT